MGEGSNVHPQILRIEWRDDDDDTKNVVTILVDNKTLFNLLADPAGAGFKGRELLQALCERGVALSDTVDQNGQRQAAWQAFDSHSGHLTYVGHYQADRLQDPETGEAAEQSFDPPTGNLIRLEHYQAGQPQDPTSGEPALQIFNPETGWITNAVRYAHGESQGVLSAAELLSLAAAKRLTPLLPAYLKNFSMPGPSPAS
jgi:hypothetical protein